MGRLEPSTFALHGAKGVEHDTPDEVPLKLLYYYIYD